MTPQERQLVAELFDRLAALEETLRDPEAERAIAQGLARAPHAVYPLVQTVLVQDARIRELEGDEAPREDGSFLDTMREAVTGRRGSVPTVRSGTIDPRWGSGAALAPTQQQQAPAPGMGGSFLGTAAAAAAGMIGGSLLLNSISSMFGHHGQASAAFDPAAGQSPWSSNAGDSDLARQAGIDDIGRSDADHATNNAGLFDVADNELADADLDSGFDPGGDGGSDFA
ncbi:MAG: uncharacterized protein QOJ96_2044 [Alphaproteobacteria bacterium]|jgi:hypothetical protein|nr:uncharacterized protein [Alphaproteobacteria bacterium]